MFEKKNTIEKKSRKHAKLCGKKSEEVLDSFSVPLTAQLTLRINKKIDFANEILSIFSIIHLFLNSQCSKKKTIEKKLRKHAKLWSEKTEEILTSISVPLTPQPTLRINKKIDFEKWDFQHIFDYPSFFKCGEGGVYVNSEGSDCDVSACPWHTDAWSGSTYEQSEQVLALWDHFCSFQEIQWFALFESLNF